MRSLNGIDLCICNVVDVKDKAMKREALFCPRGADVLYSFSVDLSSMFRSLWQGFPSFCCNKIDRQQDLGS